MVPIDWDAEAARMADYVGDEMFSAHRGVMPWRQLGIAVVFGNDGYGGDGRARREVALVREILAADGIPILGFGVDREEGYSWAMLVRSDDRERLDSIVWQCWDVACGVRPSVDPDLVLTGGYQPSTAWRAIADLGIRPDHSAN